MKRWSKTPGRWLRAFVLVAYALIGIFTFQLSIVEVVEACASHLEECDDHEEDAPCDCGADCHCCFACAHHSQAATIADGFSGPAQFLTFVELGDAFSLDVLVSAERGPPIKVPKYLA